MKNVRLFALICTLSLALLTGCGAKSGNTDAVYPQAANESAQDVITGNEAQLPETSSNSAQTDANSASAPSDAIAEDRAVEIALQHAGLAKEQITGLEVSLDQDDGHGPEYDISFLADGTEYDYEIDATDGSIRSHETELQGSDDQTPVNQAAADITEDQAVEIALQHAGCTRASVTSLQAELDEEHGRPVYEVAFHNDRTEYDYEIDAQTGDVLSYDVDLD